MATVALKQQIFVRKSEGKAYVRDRMFSTSEHLINIHERIEFLTDGVSLVSDHFPLYGMKILLGDFSAVLWREDIFTSVNGTVCMQTAKKVVLKVINCATNRKLSRAQFYSIVDHPSYCVFINV